MSDVNVIEIEAANLSVANLKSAITTAGTTTKSDLIVVRTTDAANTLEYIAATDTLNISIDAATYGSVSIIGFGSQPLTLDANGLSRAIYIDKEHTPVVNLGNLTITGGYVSDRGGGIYVGTGSTLNLTGCVVDGNQTFEYGSKYGGAGIYNLGSLTVVDSTISVPTNWREDYPFHKAVSIPGV